jgi:hypothetical protein
LAVARPMPLVPPVIRAVKKDLVAICESPFKIPFYVANAFRGLCPSFRSMPRQYVLVPNSLFKAFASVPARKARWKHLVTIGGIEEVFTA